MRSGVLSALACLLFSACASGPPVGARSVGTQTAFRPYTRGAAPRAVPSERQVRLAKTGSVEVKTQRPASEVREQIVSDARALLGKKSVVLGGTRYPSDCTGLIRGVYGQAGIELLSEYKPGDNAVTAIYRYAQKHGRVYEGGWPVPGDLVFFRETYDVNRDGRRNDGLTHIGIVEDARADGTVTVIHRVSRGVVRYRMNLQHPTVRRHPQSKEEVNDFLRPPGRGATQRLTGQLFMGYATVLPPAAPAPAPAPSVAAR